MARFNFNNITLSSSADITKVNENFNKIESNAVLKTDTATTSAAGLMTAAMVTKLNGIATGANKTTVDSTLSSSSTNPVQNKVINTALDNKVDKVTGKGLSTNDYTNEEKNKLAGVKSTVDGLATVASSGNYNDLSNQPIYNGGRLDLSNGDSTIGTLIIGRTYYLNSLYIDGVVDDKFNNSIVRIYSSDFSPVCISLLASNNMNQQGYVYYSYFYKNNVWELHSNNISQQGLLSGMIIMWSGDANNIPTGWKLCNGQNGTPDLRNRFIVGAGGDYTVGATGGSNTVTLTENQIPSHNHDFDYSTATPNNFADGDCLGGGSNLGSWTYSYTRKSITTNNVGGGQAHENRPPYYALCFIMKT